MLPFLQPLPDRLNGAETCGGGFLVSDAAVRSDVCWQLDLSHVDFVLFVFVPSDEKEAFVGQEDPLSRDSFISGLKCA